MTIRIRIKSIDDRPVIDLSGPQGNAFYLLGLVKKTFRRAGDTELGNQICDEMTKGDYKHLVETFDLYLGNYFDIVR
jgi:hypothetical protein